MAQSSKAAVAWRRGAGEHQLPEACSVWSSTRCEVLPVSGSSGRLRGVAERNGYRERPWDTRVGTIQLKVPRVRDGSFYPSILEPRKRAEQALAAVIQETYVQGVSTRRVDDLVQALGMQRVSKSQVSRTVRFGSCSIPTDLCP